MRSVPTLILLLASVFGCGPGDSTENACSPEEINELQETCLSYGGSFVGESQAYGLTDCGVDGEVDIGGGGAGGECRIEGAGSCSVICDLSAVEDSTGGTGGAGSTDEGFSARRGCGEVGWAQITVENGQGDFDDQPFACGVCLDGQLSCFMDDGSPRNVPDGTDFVQVAMERATSEYNGRACALKTSGAVICWEADPSSLEVLDLGTGLSGMSAIDMHGDFVCGLTPAGELRCDGDTHDLSWPSEALDYFQLNGSAACFVSTAGVGTCTGFLGSLLSTHGISSVPDVQAVDYSEPWEDGVICFLQQDGHPTCYSWEGEDSRFDWGAADQHEFVHMAALPEALCGIEPTGALACHGEHEGGVPSGIFVAIDSGLYAGACAIRDDGVLRCWDGIQEP